MMKTVISLCGILFLVAVTAASLEGMVQCKQPFDAKAYFAKKGIADPSSHCSDLLKDAASKLECPVPDKDKVCAETNHQAHRVKHLMEEVSEKLAKVPCTNVDDIEKEVNKKIDEIIDKLNGDSDKGTYVNPGDSCDDILSDPSKPDGMYWVWDDGTAKKVMCKRGEPLPTSCDEIFQDPTKPNGKYWINENGTPVQKECTRAYSITLFDLENFKGDSLSLNDDRYNFWNDSPPMNDKTSSFVVYTGKWTLCANIRNSASQQKPKPGDSDCNTFGVGNYNKDAVVAAFGRDNTISSAFKVA